MGADDGFESAMHAEFATYVFDVFADGAEGDGELVGDVSVGTAVCYEAQYLFFSVGVWFNEGRSGWRWGGGECWHVGSDDFGGVGV